MLASTLVIIVVFIPVMFLTGIAKFLFSPLSLTVGGAMIGSYIFSLTLIPLAAAYFYKPGSNSAERSGFQKYIKRSQESYVKVLNRVLNYRGIILSGTVVLFILSIFGFTKLGYELFPASDVGQMEIQVRMESGTTLQNANKTIIRMEGKIKDEVGNDLEQLVSNIGVFYDLPAAYTPNSGTQDAFIGIQLKSNHKISTFEYARRLRSLLKQSFPGIELSFNTGGLITAALNEGKPSPIDVQIKGNKLEVLNEIAIRIRDTIITIPEATDVRILQRLDQPAKNINLDRIKAAELGVEPVDAIKNIVSAFNSSTTYQKAFWIDERNGNHYYVGVTYPEAFINDPNVFDNILVNSKTSDRSIPFRNFSNITETTNPVEINHHNLSRVFNVYANVDGADIGSVSAEIQKRINTMTFPKGYEVKFDGEVAIIQDSFGDLGLGLLLAIILSFLILTPLFRSFRQPLIILFAFPLGMIGIVLILGLTRTYLSIQAIMGIIMMVGISVAYGNMLVDRINVLVNEGGTMINSIVNGASDRFRPILMTASTTIFGLLPTAIGFSSGSEANVPLALAVIGGTFMATLLTLFIIPILYSYLGKAKA